MAQQSFTPEVKAALMREAIALAKKGLGQVAPNPMVGAILALPDGTIIAQGWHKKYGAPHAEFEALKNINQSPPEAALFVNLEPCAHTSNTPPCCDLIIAKKITKVIYGCIDRNPAVSGRGINQLQQAGVIAEESSLAEECRHLNRVFFHNKITKKSYLAIKMATSLDGKIALASGESKWITNAESRLKVQSLRAFYQAVAVGKKTLTVDNPRLNVRDIEVSRQPTKIIFSTRGEIVNSTNLLKGSPPPRIVVVAGSTVPSAHKLSLQRYNIELLQTSSPVPSFKEALTKLYQIGISSLLLEGGQAMFTAALQENQVDYIHSFIAPKIFGASGISAVGVLGDTKLSAVKSWKINHLVKFGDDIYLEYQKNL